MWYVKDLGRSAQRGVINYAMYIEGRNTASLTFKSRLAFSIGIHVTFLARVLPVIELYRL